MGLPLPAASLSEAANQRLGGRLFPPFIPAVARSGAGRTPGFSAAAPQIGPSSIGGNCSLLCSPSRRA